MKRKYSFLLLVLWFCDEHVLLVSGGSCGSALEDFLASPNLQCSTSEAMWN